MSVESEILRIQRNIANAYAAVSGKGGEVPLQPTSASLAAAVESIPQGPAYTPGDGIDITETEGGAEISVSLPTRAVTKAEYNALTDAEKQAEVLYTITDDAGGSGGGASEVVYSTEENRIGTWIDGKPLYRKGVFIPAMTFEKGKTYNISGYDFPPYDSVDKLTAVKGTARRIGSSGYSTVIPVCGPVFDIAISYTSHYWALTSTGYEGTFDLDIVLEYTKTTNEGGTV